MDFSALTKAASKTFNNQKSLIKNVLLGRTERCEQCGQPLIVQFNQQDIHIRCQKGCTDILLDANNNK